MKNHEQGKMGDGNGSLLVSRLYMLSDSKGVFRLHTGIPLLCSCIFLSYQGSFNRSKLVVN